jgi:hypothetical protein
MRVCVGFEASRSLASLQMTTQFFGALSRVVRLAGKEKASASESGRYKDRGKYSKARGAEGRKDPQRLKPDALGSIVARLKPCHDEKQKSWT